MDFLKKQQFLNEILESEVNLLPFNDYESGPILREGQLRAGLLISHYEDLFEQGDLKGIVENYINYLLSTFGDQTPLLQTPVKSKEELHTKCIQVAITWQEFFLTHSPLDQEVLRRIAVFNLQNTYHVAPENVQLTYANIQQMRRLF